MGKCPHAGSRRAVTRMARGAAIRRRMGTGGMEDGVADLQLRDLPMMSEGTWRETRCRGAGMLLEPGTARSHMSVGGDRDCTAQQKVLRATSGDLIGALRGSALVQWWGEEDSDLDASPGAARCGHTAAVVMVRFQVPRQGE